MTRIAFLLPDFRVGGAERVALALIKAFVKRGIEVDLVLMRGEGELLSALPSEVNVVALGKRRIGATLLPFVRYLRDRKPDAVQVRMWPLTLVAILARQMARSPARIVVSDDSILSKAYHEQGPLHRLILRATISLLYPMAQARVAVSEGVADDLGTLGGLDRKSINVVYNPIEPPQPDRALPNVDWRGEGARILAVGSLAAVKNYPLLFTAFARLIKSRTARLILLGEGPERALLESLALELGIADSVTMPGHALDPSPYYASADVFVVTSDIEGFGNVLVEAMQHGLTVVSTDCPTGPREILDGGRYGYLTPCGDVDALAAAIDRACARRFPPDLLKNRAQELSGPHVVDQYLALMLPERGR